MTTRSIRLALTFLAAISGPASADTRPRPASSEPTLHQFEARQPKMGTLFRLVIWASDQATADKAADAAWARIDQLNSVLSDYDPQSELSRLCAMTDNGPMPEAAPVTNAVFPARSFMSGSRQRCLEQTLGRRVGGQGKHHADHDHACPLGRDARIVVGGASQAHDPRHRPRALRGRPGQGAAGTV